MNEEDDIFNGLGIEIELKERDDFLKVKEMLKMFKNQKLVWQR